MSRPAATLPKYLSIYLRFTEKSYLPIHKLQTKYTQYGSRKAKQPFPFIDLLYHVPASLTSSCQSALTKIASQRTPLNLKTGPPKLDFPWRDQTAVQTTGLREGFGAGFAVLPFDEVSTIQGEIFAALRQELEAAGSKSKVDENAANIWIRKSVKEVKASRVLEVLQKDYKNGMGQLVADGFVLSEDGPKGPEKKTWVFPFGGSNGN